MEVVRLFLYYEDTEDTIIVSPRISRICTYYYLVLRCGLTSQPYHGFALVQE